MTDHDRLLETPPSEEEAEQARNLARALESGTPGTADRRALAVAHLLGSLSDGLPGGGPAEGLDRSELVALASRVLAPGNAGSATPEEAEEARRLAEALEPLCSQDADPRALAVARLLESVSVDPRGDASARALARRNLVARAPRARFLGIVGRIAAVAALAAVFLSVALLRRPSGAPSAELLARREAEAKEAVASVALAGWGEWGSARLGAQMEELRTERFASSLRNGRMEDLLGETTDASPEGGGSGGERSAKTTRDSGGAS